MPTLFQDIRYALRNFAAKPGFTLVAILALALGMGANAALFSIIYAVLLKPLPYPDSERYVHIYETFPSPGGTATGTVSTPNFRDWREQNHSFDALVAFSHGSRNLQDVANPVRIPAVRATANLFSTIGIQPLVGRTFLPEEDQPDKPNVVVISERLWQRRFAGDSKLVGSTITLDGEPYVVVGIMPGSFQFPPSSARTELWVPLKFTPAESTARGSHWMFVYGKLKHNVRLETAAADMKRVAARIEKAFPDSQAGRSVLPAPLQDDIVGAIRSPLYMLLGAVACVLLIACANVANLLLARSAARKKEVAIRAALGASRSRLVRQLLTESVLLSLAGAATGLVLAYGGLNAVLVLGANIIPRTRDISLDSGVFLFLLIVSIITGMTFGLAPAISTTHTDPQEGLREGAGRGTAGRAQSRLRSALIVGEFALALVLLISAGLLLKSFAGLNGTNPGLIADKVLTLHVSIPAQKYPEGSAARRFYEPVLERMRALPGVRAAGLTSLLPLQSWGTNGDFEIEGRPPAKPGQAPFAEARLISPGYFHALGIPMIKGRDFTGADLATSPRVVIINEVLARRYFPNEDPVGKRIRAFSETWETIVGVTGNVKQAGLDRQPLPEVSAPISQIGDSGWLSDMTLVVSAGIAPTGLIGAIRSAVQAVDPNHPVYEVKTMDRVVADSLSDRKLYLGLLGAFAGTALVLALAGIYGVMSYVVTQRTQEFGLRIAMGASAGDVIRMVLRQAAGLLALGILLGLPGALMVTRVLTAFLYGVSPTDLSTYAVVTLTLSLVTLFATLVPARRATKVDPMVALRCE